MKLSEVAKATQELANNHSVLMYGPPKTGKTRLAGTSIKIPEFNRIFWFDGENGSETLLNMDLTSEELDKVTIFRIRDTRDNPIFIETMLKAMSAKNRPLICDKHGRVGCNDCKTKGLGFTEFCLGDLTHNDLVIIDSGSQLSDSALSATCLGKPDMYKPGWDEYGIQGKWLGDILSVMQQATHTNFLMVTHEIALEDDDGKDKFFPLMGTKPFSMKVAKYFGTVVYVQKKMNKHVAGSSSLYQHNLMTGSRVNAKIENDKEPDMRTIFIEGGILKEGSFHSEAQEAFSTAPVETTAVVKPLSFKDRISAKK